MKSIIKRLNKLEEEILNVKSNLRESVGVTIPINNKYEYYDLIIQSGNNKNREWGFFIKGRPIPIRGEYSERHVSYDHIPFPTFSKSREEVLSHIKKLYRSGIVVPVKELKELEDKVYFINNTDRLNFKPFGFEEGKYLFADYSVNEINNLILRHPTYRKLKALGIELYKRGTGFEGYTYSSNHYSPDIKDNKLHLEMYSASGKLIFTTESAIDNFRNYSNNVIHYSAGKIIPRTYILTRKDLDNALQAMFDSYINRDEIEDSEDEDWTTIQVKIKNNKSLNQGFKQKK